MTGGEPDTASLIALPDDWAVWRSVGLRGAGFPAGMVLRLGCSELAVTIDEIFAVERDVAEARHRLQVARRTRARARKGLADAAVDAEAAVAAQTTVLREAADRLATLRAGATRRFDEALAVVGDVLREVASEPRFREAVTWQNRGVVELALDAVARGHDGRLDSGDRSKQNVIASYLHRYCVKNDTIGFFGPVGWARLEPGATVALRAGPTLLAARNVYFEQWAIDALARAIAGVGQWRPWLCPRRYGFIRHEGTVVHSPLAGMLSLSAPEANVLAACDGLRTAQEIARDLAVDLAAAQVYEVLETLRARRIIAWELECPTTWEPGRALRSRLERVAEPGLRAGGLAALDALEESGRAVAAAAGDAERLPIALQALDATFARLTGASPTRNAGTMYAARGVVYEDCLRDVDLALGPSIVHEIGPPLSLVLASARWFTGEVGRVYTAAFRELMRKIAHGSGRAPFSEFWFRAQRLLFGDRDRPLDAVVRDLDGRWASILGPLGHARRVQLAIEDLAPRVARAFDRTERSWAVHHSPDVLIAARSVEALARGDYYSVLGEIHLAHNTLETNCFARQHPDFEELLAAMQRDMRGPRVEQAANKEMVPIRTRNALLGPDDYELETGFEPSGFSGTHVLRPGDLHVEERSADLVVSDVDGHLRLPLLAVMAPALSTAVVNALSIGGKTEHSPRISFGRMVVRRETWRFAASAPPFARAKSDFDVYLEARRWALAQELPRMVFVRSALETKPVFVDFESPIGVRIFARLVRQLQDHRRTSASQPGFVVSEMLPTIEEAWLPDAAGQRYTSELRFAVVDQR